jgi:RNA polymerase sigma-70 factor (ECF subfamily)
MADGLSPERAESKPEIADGGAGMGIDTTVPHSVRIWNYMADPCDGKQLAGALRSGSQEQLRVAFERHFDAMTLLARSLTGGSDEQVGHLLRAFWTSAVADFRQAASRGSARAWLFTRLLDSCSLAPGMPEPPDDPELPAFLPQDDPWEGHWPESPVPWRAGPELWERSPGGRAVLEGAIGALPPLELVVLILRDLDGWTAAEVGALTQLLPDEEREVLFRARLAIRAAMDPVLRVPVPGGEGDADGE